MELEALEATLWAIGATRGRRGMKIFRGLCVRKQGSRIRTPFRNNFCMADDPLSKTCSLSVMATPRQLS